MPFKFTPTEIPDVILVEAEELRDYRGYFSEIYRESDFKRRGIGPFVQQNVSVSHQGVLRGLHFQAPPMEVGKLVSCLSGQIFDVAVDIRKNSPTFGKWVSAWLSGGKSLWVPPGFAHGFYAMDNNTTVLYRQTQYYSKEHDRALHWRDPDIGIVWPRLFQPVISEKDSNAPLLKDLVP